MGCVLDVVLRCHGVLVVSLVLLLMLWACSITTHHVVLLIHEIDLFVRLSRHIVKDCISRVVTIANMGSTLVLVPIG